MSRARACMPVRIAVSAARIFHAARGCFCSDCSSGNTNGLSDSDKSVANQPSQRAQALLACINDPEDQALAECSIRLSHRLFRAVLPRIGDSDRALAFFKWSLARPGFTHNSFTVKQMVELLERMNRHEEADSLYLSWKLQCCNPQLMLLYTTDEAVLDLLREMQLKDSDAALLNRCLGNLCWARRLQHALMVFEEGKKLGVVPNARTYSLLILALSKAKSKWKHELLELIAEVRASGFRGNTSVCNAVVAGHARVESVEKAFQVLEELVTFEEFVPDSRTYNVLVEAFCEDGRMEEAWEMVEKADFSNKKTFKTFVHGFLKRGDVERAGELLLDATRKHGLLKTVTYTCVLDYLCKAFRVEEAWDFVKKAESLGFVPDVFTFNSLINVLCKSGKLDEAERLLGVMLEQGCIPDARTYGPLFHEFSKTGRVEEAKLLVERISCSCIDVQNYNNLIAGHCKAGDLSGADRCLEEMMDRGLSPNVFTYNILLEHLTSSRSFRRSFKLLRSMNQEGVLPDVVSLNTLIGALLSSQREPRARKLLGEMVHERGCQPSLYTLNIVLNWLCTKQPREERHMHEALALFEVAVSARGFAPNLVTYNILIRGLCIRGQLEEAQSMLGTMLERGCSPVVESCNEVIDALCRAGSLDRALKLLDSMGSLNLVPNSRSYHCIVRELCQFGKVDEAIGLLQHMPCAGDEDMLCTLVKGLEKLQLRK